MIALAPTALFIIGGACAPPFLARPPSTGDAPIPGFVSPVSRGALTDAQLAADPRSGAALTHMQPPRTSKGDHSNTLAARNDFGIVGTPKCVRAAARSSSSGRRRRPW